MQKCLLVILLTLLFTSQLLYASAIKGTVLEEESKEPLEGANVSLYKFTDTTDVFKGTVADSDGAFILKDITPEKYKIVISFMGFKSHTIQKISVVDDVDLGAIYLEPKEILMESVTVKDEQEILTNTLEKKIYNVDKDIISQSGSASELLQNIPSVTVDIDGNVTLRNSGNITFFINGKPSAMLKRNSAAVLKQIPAGTIQRIEIITNPSAKYRPDGVGGIINIVLKKESGQGLSGQLGANIGNESRYNGNANINYNDGNIKIFGNYGLRHSNGTVLYDDSRTYKNPSDNSVNSMYKENGHSTNDALAHTISTGINYYLDVNNSFELSFDYFLQNTFHKGLSNINFYDLQKDNKNIYSDQQTNDEHEEEGEGSFSYEHSFNDSKDHSITFEGVYSSFNEKEDQHYEQIYTFPENLFELSSNLVQKSGNQKQLLIDYSLPVNEDVEIESGYSGEYSFQDIRYKPDDSANRFLFNQDIHAFYFTYSQSFENFEYKAGLRGEQAFIKSHLTVPIDSLTKKDYFRLFPTLHFNYEISENDKLSLSYSKRLNRPDADEMNPNPEYTDPRTAEAGNPSLAPEQIHSIEFGYQSINEKMTFTNTLYYRYKYDAFTSIRKSIGDTLVLFSTDNLKTQSSLGFESVFSGSISDFWDYNITGDVFYTTIDASNIGYSNKKSTLSGNIQGQSLFNIFENTAFQLNAFYYFPTITPQGKRNSFYYFNFAFKQQFINKKLAFTFAISDAFHTYEVNRQVSSNEFNQEYSIKRKYPVFYLGITWKINDFEKEESPYPTEGLRK